jgi:nitrite reductase/ring-hydroxylating ferredoxin subunit
MSWLSEHITELLAERELAPTARQLAIERSHLSGIMAGTRTANETLVKRLAVYFGEDPDVWLAQTHPSENGAEAPAPVPTRTGFFTVARLADVPDGEVIMVADGAAALTNIGGQLYAFSNVCPHGGGNLGEGFLVDDYVVECPWHAGHWDVRTGEPLSSLAVAAVPTYEVRVRGDEIELKLS